MSKNKIQRWTDRDYQLAVAGGYRVNNVLLTESEYRKLPGQFKTGDVVRVKGLRDDKRFRGFEPESGYNLKNVSEWSRTKKNNIKNAVKTAHYLNIREKTGTVMLVTLPSASAKKEIIKTMGFDKSISLKNVVGIPIVKPSHVEPSDLKISWNKTNKTLIIENKKEGLLNIRVPIDYRAIYKDMDESGAFDLEEEEADDYFAHALERQLIQKMGQYNDGQSFFRPSTFAGDLETTSYGAYQTLEYAIEKIVQIAENYVDPNKPDFGLMVNAISVYRDTKSRDMSKQQLNTALSNTGVKSRWKRR